MTRKIDLTRIAMTLVLSVFLSACAPDRPEQVKTGEIPKGEFDPEAWGKVYPLHYESWKKTQEPKPVGLSKYKRGFDEDNIVYDRLSQLPFSALLYNGWGFGIEYNEPRGHYYALTDQIEIDPSRTKAGGVCLACKNPYHKTYTEKFGMKYLKAPFMEAVSMFPEKMQKSGPACIDCHEPSTMGIRPNKSHLERGLAMIGKEKPGQQELRTIACAQCHITYFVPRDQDMKVSGDVNLPWSKSSWGNISVENIIEDLLSDYQRIEWTQKVTGFGMPYIRHPEFEFFTRQSTHFNAGLACADCHMPYTRSGVSKISDHNVTSPLKREMAACAQCHTEAASWLKKQVGIIQDRTASLLNRAGYATASAAKLIERVHAEKEKGFSPDPALYEKAVSLYKHAFLRVVFIGAENSMGFHNPSEAGRIMGDAIRFASKSEGLLRQILAMGGFPVPEKIDLELPKYLDNRGTKKLMFKKEQELPDPFGLESLFSELP
jgi:nitrite reductase (cytochrome c-552)